MKSEAYLQFLQNKIVTTPRSGFKPDDSSLHTSNKPHQRDVIKWAAEGGRRAIFASFGLGKTQIQLELARLANIESNGRCLIICPLGVKQEFKKDAERLGMEVQYVRNDEEVLSASTPFLLTNYERVRDGGITPSNFEFVSLDEASVLRSYGSKTYQTFLTIFEAVKYRYVCTATPSPNKYKELIHYAGFLGVMDTGQALTRFFKRDSTKANNLTLYPHKEKEFWLWVSSWATFLTKPSDLGYSDEGYDLPELKVIYHRIEILPENLETDRMTGHVKMFRDSATDLKSAAKEKRSSLDLRVQKAVDIINGKDPDKHWLIWHHLEDERRAIEKAIPRSISIYGSQKDEVKEELLIGFSKGDFPILATKPEIAGQGCNFQYHCHSNIFLGINDKFNDFIQAIHRTARYQQKHEVEVHIIHTDSEDEIVKRFQEKWHRHNELIKIMTDIIKEHGLTASKMDEIKRSIGVERKEVKGDLFTVVNNDSVLESQTMEENSVGLILTSIPFSNHYEYTPSYNDFGHTNDDDHFFQQMDFLTPELLRILQPGRVAAIHVKDRIMFGSVTGYGMPSVNPFHAKTIFHFTKHGFIFIGQITIETDVVRENNQTYRLGWTEQCKDGSKMGVGSPEYLLLFRKLPTNREKAYSDIPVTKSKEEYSRGRWQIDARAKWNSSGNRLLSPQEISHLPVDKISDRFYQFYVENLYSYPDHVAMAEMLDQHGKLPSTFEMLKVPARTENVWDDVVRMRTLNSNQTQSREQNHVCPLQLDIVERTINRYSNKGDLVYDPFGGLMTTPYTAVKMDRRGYGSELNPDYFRCGARYCQEAEAGKNVPTLFSMEDIAV